MSAGDEDAQAQAEPPLRRSFLFLQGPISPFFPALASTLKARGHAAHRINVCLGDRLLWNGLLWPQPEWREFRATGVTVEDFRSPLSEWHAHVDRALEERGVTDLVLLGEQRPYHRIAIAAAKARGITVSATDFGYIRPDWIIVERDGHNALSHFPRDPATILALAEGLPPVDEVRHFADHFPTQARWDVLFHLANLALWPFPHFQGFQLHPIIPAYVGTAWRLVLRRRTRRRAEALVARLPEQAPFFLFAMQMENDYSIRAYSPYPDMDSALRETVRSFAAHAPVDAHLAVKVHPLDPGMKHWTGRLARMARQAGVRDRVHLVDAIALDPLLLRATGVITVNSTAGIRALQFGKPVAALGDALYRVQGMTHEEGLHSFWTQARMPDPALTDAFLRGIGHHLHVRGGFYSPGGVAAAVSATADRLEAGLVDFSRLPKPAGRSAVTTAPERRLPIYRPEGID